MAERRRTPVDAETRAHLLAELERVRPLELPDGSAIVAGVGARFDVSVDEVRALLQLTLDQAGLTTTSLTALITVAGKADQQALLALAAELGIPLLSHSAEHLAEVAVPHPSAQVQATVGTPSVAEAAALLGLPQWRAVPPSEASVDLLVPKTSSPRATVAIARHWQTDLHHHGDNELAPGMLDLAVNVTAEPTPDWLTAAITGAVTDLSGYPDARAATAAVAAHHGRTEAEVLLTAGAAEAFTLVAQSLRTIRGARALIVHPQFTEPEVALRAARWPIERLVLTNRGWFGLSPSKVPASATLVVIGNPTNPTGALHSAKSILRLRRTGRVLLIDEAFMDSVPGETESLLAEPDLTGILVVRSLTKTWGLAGLRIGYLVGDPELIAEAAKVQPHWSVSSPALAAARACATEPARREAERRAELIVAERELLRTALKDRGFAVAPTSSGPFLLARHPNRPDLHRELRGRQIALRRADTFPGLGTGWVRISVRDADVRTRLLQALDG